MSDRAFNLLGRINPWIPTALFVGPPILVVALSLGPLAFQLGLGIYVAATMILAAAMSYGGCEVVALPSLLLKQRHVVYCPTNIVDIMEDVAVKDAPKRQARNPHRPETDSA